MSPFWGVEWEPDLWEISCWLGLYGSRPTPIPSLHWWCPHSCFMFLSAFPLYLLRLLCCAFSKDGPKLAASNCHPRQTLHSERHSSPLLAPPDCPPNTTWHSRRLPSGWAAPVHFPARCSSNAYSIPNLCGSFGLREPQAMCPSIDYAHVILIAVTTESF